MRTEEAQLLARLAELGYRVEWQRPCRPQGVTYEAGRRVPGPQTRIILTRVAA